MTTTSQFYDYYELYYYYEHKITNIKQTIYNNVQFHATAGFLSNYVRYFCPLFAAEQAAPSL